MLNRKLLTITAATVFLASPVAFAQQTNSSSGVTSGPAAGGNVKPSTATDGSSEGRSSTSDQTSASAGGAPGVQAKPGTESGAKAGGMKNSGQ